MNWEMLAAFGQLAAVFVGIPSLIYLAVQIREQTKERRQSAVNALTVQSKLRFSAFLNTFLNHFEAMYFAHSEGLLTSIGMG